MLAVALTNRGRLTWTREPPNPVHVFWHLLDEQGKILQWDNPRHRGQRQAHRDFVGRIQVNHSRWRR
jgi:hypothetical protein